MFGRIFDIWVVSIVLIAIVFVAGVAGYQVVGIENLTNPVAGGIIVAALAIPLNALLIGSTGTTLGKWIFGTRITNQDGTKIGLKSAFKREFGVFLTGNALGIPLLQLIAFYMSYKDLRDLGGTDWDRGQTWVITHRPNNAFQIVLSICGVVTVLTLFFLFKALERSAG